VRYTPTVVTTLLLLVAVLTVVAASLLAPSRWFGRVERWAFWRRESVRGRVRDRRGLAYLYAGLLAGVAAVLVVWPLPSLLTRHPRVDAAARHTAITTPTPAPAWSPRWPCSAPVSASPTPPVPTG
jgi:hypothetical protein